MNYNEKGFLYNPKSRNIITNNFPTDGDAITRNDANVGVKQQFLNESQKRLNQEAKNRLVVLPIIGDKENVIIGNEDTQTRGKIRKTWGKFSLEQVKHDQKTEIKTWEEFFNKLKKQF